MLSKINRLSLSSLLISISLILCHIKISSPFTFGGSITLFSCVPLLIISFKYNFKWGVFSGFIFGLLHFITSHSKLQGFSFFSVFISIFLDYIVAYSIIGFSSFFLSIFRCNFKYSSIIAASCSFFFKFLIHIISGFIIWLPIFNYSLLHTFYFSLFYNASYSIPEYFINILGLFLLNKYFPHIFLHS